MCGRSTSDDLKTLDEQTFLDVFEGVPQAEINLSQIKEGLGVVAAFAETVFLKSNGEVRRALKENSISVNKNKVTEDFVINTSQLINNQFDLLQRWNKNHFILKAV